VIPAGRRSVFALAQVPVGGVPASPARELAWYDGRGRIVSDTGDVVYTVERKAERFLVQEIWAMRADGSGKRLVKTYVGCEVTVGPWVPGSQWVMVVSRYAKTGSVSTETRRVVGEGYGPILRAPQAWLLDVETGQEARLVSLPEGYMPHTFAMSPDGSQVLFDGAYWPGFPRAEPASRGPWVYAVETGEIRELADAGVGYPASWSPDERTVATSYAKDQDVGKASLRLVDTRTGEVSELGIRGYAPVFSPDGSRLAYCGDHVWLPKGEYQDRIYVLDLSTHRTAPVTPLVTRAQSISWSPDGGSVAYVENHETYTDPDDGIVLPDYVLCVSAADGSGRRELYRAHEFLRALSWSAAGDAVYVSTSKGVHRVALDGTGAADLGGTEYDSVLSPGQQRDLSGAVDALRDAIYWFTLAQERKEAAKVAEGKAAYARSAEAFAGIPWHYPLAQLSSAQVLMHADRAQADADRPEPEVLESICHERLRHMALMAVTEAPRHGGLPPTLDTTTLRNWGTGRWNTPEWVERQASGCPAGGEWIYVPPKGAPAAGEVLLHCSRHPESRWVWRQRDVDAYLTALKHTAP
jgi:Tol biopolymer transport system component